ncbi:hypothetical protein Tco_0545443, partial [Tanacetum coccineum]
MMGRKFIANAYIDLDLPMNVMSLAYYNTIRSQGYEHRGLNFVGIGMNMHVFIRNLSYVLDFTILKNVEANIDPNSSQVVFGRPFVETTKLILDGEKALIKFIDGTRKVAYETPYKDPKMDDLTSEGHYLLSSKIILSDDDISITHDCNKRDVLESDCTNELGNKVDEPIELSDHMFRTSEIQVMPRYPKFKFCSRTLVADGATTGITVVLINFPVGTTWAGVILGKDNEENILQSIDEGPFKMGKFRETLAEGAEDALHLGPKRDRVFADLTPEEKKKWPLIYLNAQLSSYTSGHLEVSELAACLEKLHFPALLVMSNNMDSSMGKMCLGKDVIEISSDRNEGSRDWDSPEYKDTAGSGGKKEPEALVFRKMYTEEDSDRYIAQCFVDGLYASDGEINLEKNNNLISNDYAVKLCLEYKVRKGKKLVKKEFMVLLRGEVYFVQFIINPEEDKFEPGLIFGRSFLRSAHAIVNVGEGTITIQPDFDPFLLSSNEEETDLPLLIYKMGKGSRNKKKILENIMYFNGVGPSSSIGTPLTQEEAERRALAHSISMRCLRKRKIQRHLYFQLGLEGRINENALADTGSDTNTMPYRIYEQPVGFTTLSAKFLILEIPVDRDAPIVVGRGFLDTIGGNIDIPNRIFTTFDGLTRQTFRAARSEKIKTAKSDLDDEEDYTSGAYDHEAGSSRAKRSRNVETMEEALLPYVHHEFLEWRGCSIEAKSRYNSRLVTLLPKLIYSPQIVDWQLLHKIGCGDEIDQMLEISLKEAQTEEEVFFSVAWVRAFNIREPIYPELCREFYATYEFDE